MTRFRWGWKHGRRDNRRRERAIHVEYRKATGVALLTVTVLGGLAVGWSELMQYAMHHPYFAVQDIVVEDDAEFFQEEIQAQSGLMPGMSMWEVDPQQVEHRLLARPWIQTAQVRREFPHRVFISVRTRRPVAIVAHNVLTYLDETGICFTRPGQGAVDLPYISGFAELALDTPAIRTALAGVLRLLSLARLWQEPLSEIHWDPQQGYTLFLEQRRVTVWVGWETTPEKFAQVGSVLVDWPPDAPAALFDARFADQVVVRPYTDESSPRTRALSRPL